MKSEPELRGIRSNITEANIGNFIPNSQSNKWWALLNMTSLEKEKTEKLTNLLITPYNY